MVLSGAAAAGAGVGAPSGLGGNVWRFPITGLAAGQLDIRLAPDPNDIKDLAGNDLAEVDWSYTIVFPVISVTLDSNSWAVGTISPGDVLSSGPFTATNNGNVPEDFTIVGSDATNGWMLGSAVGLDTFKVEADLGNDGSYETLLNLSYQLFATNVAVSGTRLLGLRYSAPDDDTKGDNVSHDFTVTIRAVRHAP